MLSPFAGIGSLKLNLRRTATIPFVLRQALGAYLRRNDRANSFAIVNRRWLS